MEKHSYRPCPARCQSLSVHGGWPVFNLASKRLENTLQLLLKMTQRRELWMKRGPTVHCPLETMTQQLSCVSTAEEEYTVENDIKAVRGVQVEGGVDIQPVTCSKRWRCLGGDHPIKTGPKEEARHSNSPTQGVKGAHVVDLTFYRYSIYLIFNI